MKERRRAGLISLALLLSVNLLAGEEIGFESVATRDEMRASIAPVPEGSANRPTGQDDWQQQLQHALDLQTLGNFAEAERTLNTSIRKAEQPDSDPLWLPTALDRLGALNRHVGRNRQAEHLYLRAADLWQTRFGSKSLGLAMTLSDLAWVYVALGNFGRAQSLWRSSLEIRTLVFGPFHPAVARVYGYMAASAFAAHLPDDAESFCRQALRIYERTGNIPGETDQVLSSLASVRLQQGRASEAITLAKQAIDLGQTAKPRSMRLLGG